MADKRFDPSDISMMAVYAGPGYKESPAEMMMMGVYAGPPGAGIENKGVYRFCQECGSRLNAGDIFCRECGTKTGEK